MRDLSEVCVQSAVRKAEAQDFAVLIARGIFSAMPFLEVTSPGIPRSRRQLAGL